MTRAILVATLLFSALAHAQQPDLMTLGKQEFETAKKEFNLGHYDKALEHFETSYRLTALPELLYNLGVVNRHLFERSRKPEYLEQAIERFKTYLANPRSTADPVRRVSVEKELKDVEDLLARDKAARAKGEAALGLGEEFLSQGRVDDAKARLESYLRAPDNERAGVVRASLLAAAIALKQHDAPGAQQAFARALELDRAVQPPAEPEAHKLFEAARAQLGEGAALSVSHTPPASVKAGAPIELRFVVQNDKLALVSGVRVHYRLGGGKAFSALPLQPAGPGSPKIALPRAFTMSVPPGARIEYFATGVGENDAALEHIGSDALPFALQVEAQKGPSVAKKWWFWTAMTVAAGAVATGIALSVTLTQPPPPTDIPIRTGLR
jgi:tetratricopeptide (TPR) repeat protein